MQQPQDGSSTRTFSVQLHPLQLVLRRGDLTARFVDGRFAARPLLRGLGLGREHLGDLAQRAAGLGVAIVFLVARDFLLDLLRGLLRRGQRLLPGSEHALVPLPAAMV